ncbi:uncharacterized protein [Watersipora subatra]|uniref:uncharacterized protein isoform X1 n=3 Tax=Watersipora subatra TaxID=2589382 RepID=UPI00355AFFA0
MKCAMSTKQQLMFADSLSDALSLIKAHEIEYMVKYISFDGKLSKLRTESENKPLSLPDVQKRRVVAYQGKAVIKLGSVTLACQHGADHNAGKKLKLAAEQTQNKDHDFEKKKVYIQDSWKLSCPAKAHIARQIVITGFELDHMCGSQRDRHWQLIASSTHALKMGQCSLKERFIISISHASEHQGHPIGEHSGYLPMDKRVQDRVTYIVNKLYVTQTKLVARHLADFVETSLFHGNPPPKSNRRFYPSAKELKNCIDRVTAANHTHSDDQDNVAELLRRLDPNNRWSFRKSTDTGEKLMLVHQTRDQQQLLYKYGNEICLLDATHKTTRYGIPLFFIVVKANVNYQIIASFVVLEETEEAIKEAIAVVKSWNQSWQPKSWMVDCCAAEISAVSTTFPDSTILVCDFHRLQAWNRWLVKGTNNINKDVQKNLKKLLGEVAKSQTEEIYLQNMTELQGSKEWMDHKNVQAYFNQTWFSNGMHKRWVKCFRLTRELRAVNTNNGIEAINRAAKVEIAAGARAQTLTAMMVKLMRWLAAHHKKYVDKNIRFSSMSRRYAKDIPAALHNRPHDFVKHVIKRLESARELLCSNSPEQYIVDAKSSMPSCSCEDFSRHSFPCKHIIRHWFDEDGQLCIPSNLTVTPWICLDVCDGNREDNAYTPPTKLSTYTEAIPQCFPNKSTSDESTLAKLLGKIRAFADDIKSWTYNCVEKDVANTVLQRLEEMQPLCVGTNIKANLIVRPSTSGKQRRLTLRDGGLKRRRRMPLKYRRRLAGITSVPLAETLDDCFPTNQYSGPGLELVGRQKKRYPQDPNSSIQISSVWLADDDMELAVNLIRFQWPDIKTQAPCYIQRPGGFDTANHSKYVQILHTNGNHWLACTNIGSSTFVRLFDSLAFDLDDQALKGIASLHKTLAPHLRLRWESVQRQDGANDCGLFAIAFLVETLFGFNPAKVTFDQRLLRMHLFNCLKEGEFTRFPKCLEEKRRVRSKYVTVKVYCKCRLTWRRDGEEGVECDQCGDWYHSHCVGLPIGYTIGKHIIPYRCDSCI